VYTIKGRLSLKGFSPKRGWPIEIVEKKSFEQFRDLSNAQPTLVSHGNFRV
jgi:hypothetical protein